MKKFNKKSPFPEWKMVTKIKKKTHNIQTTFNAYHQE